MKQINQIIVCGTAFLFICDWTHRPTVVAVVVVQVAVVLEADEVAGVVVAVPVVVRAGPEEAVAALRVEIVVAPDAGERQEYAVAVWTGNIVSSDSVV